MMEDRLHELPKGWIVTRLGELFDISYGLSESLSKTENDNELDLPVIRIPNITQWGSLDLSNLKFFPLEKDKRANLLLRKGDILFNWRNAPKWIGKSAVFEKEGEYVNASFLLKLRPYLIGYSHFVSLCLNHLRITGYFLTKVANAVNQANFNANMTKQVEIPVPPLPEQHRIVAKIEELFTKLDAGVEALKKIKAQLKRYRQAVLKYAFEGKLTQEWREANKGKFEPASVLLERIKEQRKKEAKGKFKELPPVDTSQLPELPDGWVWTVLGNIASIQGGFAFKSAEYKDNGIPLLRISNIKDYKVTFEEDTVFLDEKFVQEYPEFLVNKGNILIALSGATTGKFGVYDKDQTALLNQRVGQIKSWDETLISSPLIFYYLNIIRGKILNQAYGMAQPNISTRELQEFSIPLPPVPEQQKIVEEIESRLSIADNMEKVVEQSLKQSDRLRQSILKRAFEGKLVPQDPTDEPAEKLLERIKEEKAKREAENKKEKKHKGKKPKQMELI